MRWRLLFTALATLASMLATAPYAVPGQASSRSGGAAAGEPLYAFNTGLVLSISQHAGRGAPVRVAKDSDGAGQRWIFAGHSTIRPAANQKLCLNMASSRRSGYRLDMSPCTGAASERFITRMPSAHTPVLFISPTGRRSLCVSAQTAVSLYATSVLSPFARLSPCSSTQGQAWSTSDLATVVGQFSPDFTHDMIVPDGAAPGVQASLRPVGSGLDEEWVLTAIGAEWTFSPIQDTALCLTIHGPVRLSARLILTACSRSSAQSFVTIDLRFTTTLSYYLFAADNGAHCLGVGHTAKPPRRPLVLAACPNTGSQDATGFSPEATGIWMSPDTTAIAYFWLDPTTTGEFQEFWSDPDTSSNEYGMTADGTASGTPVQLESSVNGITQTWTDIAPGALTAGNPDGSISIRPLNDLHLCLTVAGADQVGSELQVQTCDGEGDQEFGAAQADASGEGWFWPYSAPSLCIGPAGDSATAGETVVLETCGAAVNTWGSWNDWNAWVTPR